MRGAVGVFYDKSTNEYFEELGCDDFVLDKVNPRAKPANMADDPALLDEAEAEADLKSWKQDWVRTGGRLLMPFHQLAFGPRPEQLSILAGLTFDDTLFMQVYQSWLNGYAETEKASKLPEVKLHAAYMRAVYDSQTNEFKAGLKEHLAQEHERQIEVYTWLKDAGEQEKTLNTITKCEGQIGVKSVHSGMTIDSRSLKWNEADPTGFHSMEEVDAERLNDVTAVWNNDDSVCRERNSRGVIEIVASPNRVRCAS
ncbi:hypothetical protein EWM64_g7073 [Hericium alpestre]|uniref:Uncharacterized protein n=1 Tax=Hericium alpestre TaxID=135208 RepID=A0A4Y9ZRT6_9AGAM|nr:hypothetical protein EWM64_g7073 [Hericium alpestre]